MTLLNIVGGDFKFENIKLHNPSIEEISEKINDEDDFLFALKILSSPLLQNIQNIPNNIPLEKTTNFDIFLSLIIGAKAFIDNNIFSKAQFYAINELLQLLFLDYKISLGNNEIIFSKNKNTDIVILNSTNFDLFQKIIQQMFKTSSFFNNDNDENYYNPATEKAKAIVEKLKNSKNKILKQKNKKDYKTSLIENYIMIISIGLNISPRQVSKLTLYQILVLFERIRMKIEWDLDISCRLAGGDPGDRPDNWMAIL